MNEILYFALKRRKGASDTLPNQKGLRTTELLLVPASIDS